MRFSRETSAAGLTGHPALRAPDFERVRRMAYDHFGLDLRDGKQALVEARLGKMLRRKGLSTFRELLDHVTADSTGEAMVEMVDLLTTNFTSFLREPAHFEFIRKALVPELKQRGAIDVWSAACSTGEEPYSILFTLLDALGDSANVRILATDISTRALAAADAGVYQKERLASVPEPWLRRFFLRGEGQWKGWLRVKPQYRAMVTRSRLNLISGQLPAARFPLIFCRNVMIYFDKPTQAAVVRRMASALEPGGHLLVGHAESLTGCEGGLEYVSPAIYRKAGKGETWRTRRS